MVMTVNRWTQVPLVPSASVSGNIHILTFLRRWHSVVSIFSRFLSHWWSLLPPPPRSLPWSPPGRMTCLFLCNLTAHYLFILAIVILKPKSLSLPISCPVSWQSLCLFPLLLLQHLAHARHGVGAQQMTTKLRWKTLYFKCSPVPSALTARWINHHSPIILLGRTLTNAHGTRHTRPRKLCCASSSGTPGELCAHQPVRSAPEPAHHGSCNCY